MTTTAAPINSESLARNFSEIRKDHERRKLFFKIGDEVHVIRKRKILNGIIQNYDGKHKSPYQVFMLDGTTHHFSVATLRVGHASNVRDSSKKPLKPPNLVIVHSSEPVFVIFD
jgi:hypothetical protein